MIYLYKVRKSGQASRNMFPPRILARFAALRFRTKGGV